MTARNRIEAAPRHLLALLRSSETISTWVSCRSSGIDRGSAESRSSSGYAAVVTSAEDGTAAIFVWSDSYVGSSPGLRHIVPVTPSITLSLNQESPSGSSMIATSARPLISLTLSSGKQEVEIALSPSDTSAIQALVADIKRLKAEADSRSPAPLSPPWLGYYPVLASTPDDAVPEDEAAVPVKPSEGSAQSGASDKPSYQSLDDLSLSSGTHDDKDDEHINPLASGFSRTAFLRQRVFAAEAEWSKRKPLKIRIGTYNVNDKLPPETASEIAGFVGKGEEDLLVFGFQEVDLRSTALFVSQGNTRMDSWSTAILNALDQKAEDFTQIAATQYVGVVMLVFIRKTLREAVSAIETSERGIGLWGFGGNKAGVAVRLKIHDTTLCFVDSHLAAFAEYLDRRRSDYKALKAGLAFPPLTLAKDDEALDEFQSDNSGDALGVEDCNALFWLGDLNYRIDEGDSRLNAMVKDEQWAQILAKDQLKADIAGGKSFEGYKEGDIGFAPTFKYVHGSAIRDPRRAPAYTDRILWKTPEIPAGATNQGKESGSSLPGSFPSNGSKKPDDSTLSSGPTPLPAHTVVCQQYTSHPIFLSDHLPVSATLNTKVRVANVEKKKAALEDAKKRLERLEEVWRPAVQVDRTELDFGQIKYRRQVVQEVRVSNTGRVPVELSFRRSGANQSICKPFYWVVPAGATVPPGQSLTLCVAAYVDHLRARPLTAGMDMNDVLVMEAAGGKDTILTLSAVFSPTIIGLPLELYSQLSGPIRDASLAVRRSLIPPPPDKEGSLPTPISETPPPLLSDTGAGMRPAKEIWRLLEYLMEHGQGQGRELWVRSEDAEGDDPVLEIIEAIDTGSSLPSNQARPVSLALLHILQVLPNPLIARQWHPFCLTARDRDEAFACLEGLQGVYTNVLIGLMSVVRLCSSPAQPGDTAGGESETTETTGVQSQLVGILSETIFGPMVAKEGVEVRDYQKRYTRLLLDG